MATAKTQMQTGPGPNPPPTVDPTLRTKEAVAEAADVWRRELQSVRELLEVRLDAMDQAVRLAATELAKVPERGHSERIHLREEYDQRLKSEREFILGQIAIALAETRRVGDVAQEKFAAIDLLFNANALALTAALAAQKEAAAETTKSGNLAIAKSEQATKETISAEAAKNQTEAAASTAALADLKERIVRIETGGIVTASNRTESRQDNSQTVAIIGAILFIISIIATVVLAIALRK